jgi:hypothetical protein
VCIAIHLGNMPEDIVVETVSELDDMESDGEEWLSGMLQGDSANEGCCYGTNNENPSAFACQREACRTADQYNVASIINEAVHHSSHASCSGTNIMDTNIDLQEPQSSGESMSCSSVQSLDDVADVIMEATNAASASTRPTRQDQSLTRLLRDVKLCSSPFPSYQKQISVSKLWEDTRC